MWQFIVRFMYLCMKKTASIILLSIFSCCFGHAGKCFSPGTGCYTDTLCRIDTVCTHVIYFEHNSSVVDKGYLSNTETIAKLDSVLRDTSLMNHLEFIDITASTSPDGVYEHNMKLAERRVCALKDYMACKYPEIDQKKVRLHNGGENWQGLLDAVQNDRNVPYREKVLEIIRQDVNLGTKKWRLQHVGGGEAWEYIKANLLVVLRSVSANVVVLVKNPVPSPVTETPVVAQTGKEDKQAEKPDTVKSEKVLPEKPVVKPVPEIVPPVEKSPESRPWLAVKTNAVAYIALVANVGVEVPLGKKFSFDFPFYYSPYHVSDKYKFRVLGFEPEVKYWFDRPFQGHAVGIHGIGVMFNVAFNDRDRFQNHDEGKLQYGAGLSYGYTMKLNGNWRIEYTVGGGYLYLDYDVFRNVENGVLYDRRKFHYWGLTKFGVNIIYLFNKR